MMCPLHTSALLERARQSTRIKKRKQNLANKKKKRGETEEESSSTAKEGPVDVEGERLKRQTQTLETTRPETFPQRQCLV